MKPNRAPIIGLAAVAAGTATGAAAAVDTVTEEVPAVATAAVAAVVTAEDKIDIKSVHICKPFFLRVVFHINLEQNTGNGFLFETYDSGGLEWAIDQAMAFYQKDVHTRSAQIGRVMAESKVRFSHTVTAQAYIDIYEQMLQRPLIDEVFDKSNKVDE